MAIISNYQTLTGRAPVFISAEVGNISADRIILTYSKSHDRSIVPATTDFSISGTLATITTVELVNNGVILVMSALLLNIDTLNVSYTAGVNALQDTSNNTSLNLTSVLIQNNI